MFSTTRRPIAPACLKLMDITGNRPVHTTAVSVDINIRLDINPVFGYSGNRPGLSDESDSVLMAVHPSDGLKKGFYMRTNIIKALIFLIVVLSNTCQGGEYRIGPKDILSISFWQQPDLNTVVAVRQGGLVSIPVIGEIEAADKTTAELASDIVQRMSFYNPKISQATVVVTEYNSRVVYVTGQVLSPGRLSFEVFPNVWEAIQQAGGPTEEADLSRVKIVHGKTGKIETVNIEAYLKEGNLSELPVLSYDDNVDVPRYALAAGGRLAGAIEGRKVYFIYGAVNNPGVMNLEEGIDILDAIVLAGGPTTDARLSEVRVISKANPYSQVTRVDIDKYSKDGYPARIPIKPEDTIVIPRGASTWGAVMSVIGDVLPIVAATSSTIIAISAYRDRNR